jgi:hypothetical protein
LVTGLAAFAATTTTFCPTTSEAGSSAPLDGAEAGVTLGKPFSVCSH